MTSPRVLARCVAIVLVAACVSIGPAFGASASRAAAKPTLDCKDVIGGSRTVLPGYSVVLNRAGLPTGSAFAAAKIHDPNPARRYFAKQGLLIKAGASFQLIVPAAWTSRLAISWGNPGTITTHLWITGCGSTKPGANWLGFAGGFTLDKPACVPLIVKTAAAQRTVHIGAGKACPGQSPPPK